MEITVVTRLKALVVRLSLSILPIRLRPALTAVQSLRD